MLLSPEKKYYVYRLGLSLASGASLASAFAPANTPLFALAALILIFYIVGVTEKVSHAVPVSYTHLTLPTNSRV